MGDVVECEYVYVQQKGCVGESQIEKEIPV